MEELINLQGAKALGHIGVDLVLAAAALLGLVELPIFGIHQVVPKTDIQSTLAGPIN